jgi:hypothetical protein
MTTMDSYGVTNIGQYAISIPGVTIFVLIFVYQIYVILKFKPENPPMVFFLAVLALGLDVLVWTLIGLWPISRW